MVSSQRLPSAQRQRQIAEAALRIISTQGVHRLTAAALAEQVGIADGTIFRHFGNKQEIVDAAIDLFQEAMEETFPAEDEAPLQRLKMFFLNRLELVRENPEILRLAFNDRLAEAAGEEGAQRVGQLVKRSVTLVHQCLAEAQDRGEIAQGVPMGMLTWMVVGVIRGASTVELGKVPGVEDLSGEAPGEVWEALERFLRSTEEGTKS